MAMIPRKKSSKQSERHNLISFFKSVPLVAIACCGGTAIGDQLPIYFGVYFTSILVLGLTGVTLSIRYLHAKASKQMFLFPARPFVIWMMAILFSSAFLWGARLKSQWRVREARSYVVSIVPELDRIKAKIGRYPKQLPASMEKRRPPMVNYFSGGKEFVFSYTEPLSIDSTYHFDSDMPVWQKWVRSSQ